MKEFKVGDFVYFEEDTGPFPDCDAMRGYGVIKSFVTEEEEEDLFFEESLENVIAAVENTYDLDGNFHKGTRWACRGSLRDGKAHIKGRIIETEKFLDRLNKLLNEQQGKGGKLAWKNTTMKKVK